MEKEKVSSGNIIDWKVVKRILEFIRPYRGRFYFLIVLTFLLGVLTPIRPMLIQYTLDKHVGAGEYWSMVYVMILILALLVLQSGVQYVHTYLSGRIGQYVIRDLRVQRHRQRGGTVGHAEILCPARRLVTWKGGRGTSRPIRDWHARTVGVAAAREINELDHAISNIPSNRSRCCQTLLGPTNPKRGAP